MNTPPADELYALRKQLDQLQQRADELRALMITDPDSRTGNQYVAIVKDVVRNQPDIEQLRLAYPDAVAEHTHKVTNKVVSFCRIDEDGVITPIKRTRP